MSRPPASGAALIEQVEQSQLLEPGKLASFLAQHGEATALLEARLAAEALVGSGLLTRFQVERLLAGEGKSLTPGRYRLVDQLGPAGSTVFLAENRGSGRRVAVKVLPVQGASPATVERFRREAEALARLDHPSIVPIRGFEEHDGQLLLFMQYVPGLTLQELIEKEGPLSFLQAVRFVRDVALGLQHVHETGLVHRDIKPGHLARNEEGTVQILDFGLARFLDEHSESVTRKYEADRVLGTIEYLAPEQLASSHDVDIRADIYGLGATFYYLLTGRAPFNRHALMRLAAGVVTHPQPVSQLRPDVPRDLQGVLDRMMALEPAQRYQTPAEVVAVLDHWVREVAPPPLVAPRRTSGSWQGVGRPAGAEAQAPEPAEEPGSWGPMLFLAGGLAFVAALLAAWKAF